MSCVGLLRSLVLLVALVLPLAHTQAFGAAATGSIRFDVHYGSQGFKVGEARHEWTIGPDGYVLSLSLEARGLAGLFGLQYEQRSAGRSVTQGMKPDLFTVDQRGRKRDSAHFDWQAGRVSIRRDDVERRSGEIAPGDQDALSLWHQARRFATSNRPVSLNVVTAKSIKRATLETLGPERLKLPVGELDTIRMRAQADGGELDIEIWLSVRHDLLPVRIRITDDDGGVLDQRASIIDLGTPVASGHTQKN